MISIVMGSQSDWNTLSHSENILKELDISYEKKLFQLIELPKDSIIMQRNWRRLKLKLS